MGCDIELLTCPTTFPPVIHGSHHLVASHSPPTRLPWPCSFYFWVDLISTVVLLVGIPAIPAAFLHSHTGSAPTQVRCGHALLQRPGPSHAVALGPSLVARWRLSGEVQGCGAQGPRPLWGSRGWQQWHSPRSTMSAPAALPLLSWGLLPCACCAALLREQELTTLEEAATAGSVKHTRSIEQAQVDGCTGSCCVPAPCRWCPLLPSMHGDVTSPLLTPPAAAATIPPPVLCPCPAWRRLPGWCGCFSSSACIASGSRTSAGSRQGRAGGDPLRMCLDACPRTRMPVLPQSLHTV